MKAAFKKLTAVKCEKRALPPTGAGAGVGAGAGGMRQAGVEAVPSGQSYVKGGVATEWTPKKINAAAAVDY